MHNASYGTFLMAHSESKITSGYFSGVKIKSKTIYLTMFNIRSLWWWWYIIVMQGINRDRYHNARDKSYWVIYLLFDKFTFQPAQHCSFILLGMTDLLHNIFLTQSCFLLMLDTRFSDHRAGGLIGIPADAAWILSRSIWKFVTLFEEQT